MNHIEAMKQALEALESFGTPHWAGTGVDKVNEAITTIRTAIKAAEKQEPVAASRPRCRDCADFGPICPNSGKPCTPPAAPVQEPVAWLDPEGDEYYNVITTSWKRKLQAMSTRLEQEHAAKHTVPLYTTPHAAQPEPVQDPVGEWVDGRGDPKRIAWNPGYVANASVGDKLYTTPPAAPVQKGN